MTRAQIECVVAELFDARMKGDAARVAQCFAPDGVYRMSGSPELGPMTAHYCGSVAIEPVVADLIQTWDFSAFPVVSTHIDGDTAHVLLKGTIRHAQSGEKIPFEILDRIVVRDGKITEFVEFLDTFEVQRVAIGQRKA